MKREIATHRERQGISLCVFVFYVFCVFCLLGVGKGVYLYWGSFSPQWFLSFAYVVDCLKIFPRFLKFFLYLPIIIIEERFFFERNWITEKREGKTLQIRTKISLGFIVLTLAALAIGVIAIFAFWQINTSLEEAQSQDPLLLVTSRMKDLISQNNSLVSSYFQEENTEKLNAIDQQFTALNNRFLLYLEALRLGTDSEEFRKWHQGMWEKENFPYSLSPLPEGSSLFQEVQELKNLQVNYQARVNMVKNLWKQYLTTKEDMNRKSI